MSFSSVKEKGFEDVKQNFIKTLCALYNDKDCERIEKLTYGQSCNTEWLEQRKGAITGTKCHRILSYCQNGKAKPENIVSHVMQYKQRTEHTCCQMGNQK